MPASSVLMVRPANFGYNEQTAVTNYFQNKIAVDSSQILNEALKEFDAMVIQLQHVGIEVIVHQEQKLPIKPDAIFPNNWFSTHPNDILIIYPMLHENRRWERSLEIISLLKKYKQQVVSLVFLEEQNEFLEGTGSLVIDEKSKTGFACISPRTTLKAIEIFESKTNYKVVKFNATDYNGKQIYHTNVLMAITNKVVIVCIEAISIEHQKIVIDELQLINKIIVPISHQQMNYFAGNMLSLNNKNGDSFLLMSQTAFDSLDKKQLEILSQHHQLLPIAIPTIEKIGGGSVRCMMAELY